MKLNNRSKFIASIFICQFAGFLGALYSRPAVADWYVSLRKPIFTPPGWVFSAVWVTLYFLMGTAFFLVWKENGAVAAFRRSRALLLIQLALNVAWSGVFFGLRSLTGGLLVILLLWPLSLAMLVVFYRLRRAAGLLLVPYLVWLGFAAVLNVVIWHLNR